MTSTIMKDSIVGDAWIQQSCQANPVQLQLDETGQPTGNILTGPVRLSWPDLFELPKPRAQQAQPGQVQSEPKYGAVLLMPPIANLQPMFDEFYRVCAQDFRDRWNEHMQQYQGVRSPFRDMAEKVKFMGYTPGGMFVTCKTKFKPAVVDARMNPIVDQSKVYPGVWAICSVNAYAYKNPTNPGVSFGLQSVMIVGDDTPLAGGGEDPNKAFAQVSVTAPTVRPDIAAGMPGAPAAPPMPGGVPHHGMPPGVPGVAPAMPQPMPAQAPAVPGAPVGGDWDWNQ